VLILSPQFNKNHFARDVRTELDVADVRPVSCSDDCSSAQSNDRPDGHTNHCRHNRRDNLQSRRLSDRYPVRIAPYHLPVLQSFGKQRPGRWLGEATTDSFDMHPHARLYRRCVTTYTVTASNATSSITMFIFSCRYYVMQQMKAIPLGQSEHQRATAEGKTFHIARNLPIRTGHYRIFT
jgi:hypothetical protein